METHKLLKRQLDKSNLSTDVLPQDLNQWQKFLSSIDLTYVEMDQERYLLERSMEIFSREMMEINFKLEEAQTVSNMGYWQYDAESGLISWSKGICKQLQINPIKPTLLYTAFLELVHPKDRPQLQHFFDKVLLDKLNYDHEIRIKITDDTYKWFRMIAKTYPNSNQLSGVLIDIDKAKIAAENISKLNSQLLATARLAGMSEIATSILHNIGNVLNSTNVSISLIKQNLEHIDHIRFLMVVGMIHDNLHNLADYLSKDKKGKHILPFLATLTEDIKSAYQSNIAEIKSLEKNMAHMNAIVSMQQTISGVSGVLEKIHVLDLIDNVLEISNVKQLDINFVKEIDSNIKTFISDKSKVLQILINLIQNARDSVLAHSTNKEKRITLSVDTIDHDTLCISVEDNGIGMPQDILNRLFSFGFTTKPDGHGFGLHSAALSAKDIGAVLTAQSRGLGHGAKFSLKLPATSSASVKKGVLNE